MSTDTIIKVNSVNTVISEGRERRAGVGYNGTFYLGMKAISQLSAK